jgi:hypothetical protein
MFKNEERTELLKISSTIERTNMKRTLLDNPIAVMMSKARKVEEKAPNPDVEWIFIPSQDISSMIPENFAEWQETDEKLLTMEVENCGGSGDNVFQLYGQIEYNSRIKAFLFSLVSSFGMSVSFRVV